MQRILLINPNSNAGTTAMMVAIAQATAGDRATITGATARHSPPMITTPGELDAAAAEVIAIGRAQAPHYTGLLIAAFGDPGADHLSQAVPIPVIGLAQASMLEAATPNRRFAVATVTPALVASIDARAHHLGLSHLYCGTRVTPTIPATPADLADALAEAVTRCIADGAEAAIIGGGPLANTAAALAARFPIPIIAPIPAAIRRLLPAIVPAKAHEETEK